jgi:hypothetical protein
VRIFVRAFLFFVLCSELCFCFLFLDEGRPLRVALPECFIFVFGGGSGGAATRYSFMLFFWFFGVLWKPLGKVHTFLLDVSVLTDSFFSVSCFFLLLTSLWIIR